MKKQLITFILFCFFQNVFSQNTDHWETVVFADDVWKYRTGTSEPPNGWWTEGFNDDNWLQGQGGFGYGDDDDNTEIAQTVTIYLRKEFELTSISNLSEAFFHADYDDGFIAYLNGVEIARSNVDGNFPPFNQASITYREALMYQGGSPQPFFINQQKVMDCMKVGTNTLSIQVHNQGENSSDMSAIFFLTVGVTDNSFTYGTPPDWFIPPLESSDLPIVIINTAQGQGVPDEPKIEADMGIIDNGVGNRNFLTDPFNGYDGKIAIETRGASSSSFPKKNYGFETQDENGDNNNVTLLGIPEENDWILHGPFSDKSMIRNVLAFHLGNLTGRWAPRTRYCELFINGEYLGVYILMEKIKRDANRVDIAKLTEDDNEGDELTGGYIVQIDREEPGNGWYSNYTYNPFFVFHHPNGDDLTSQQETYIENYITSFEDVLDNSNFNHPIDGYSKYIDVASFIDYILMCEISREVDAYRLSTYMYKDKDSNGGKLTMGPLWDYNLAFANADYCIAWEYDGWAFEDDIACGTQQPFWFDRLLEDELFRNQMHCRWEELRETVFQTDAILQFIDEQAAILNEAQARNFEKWQVLGNYVWPNFFVGNTHAEEINFLKNWMELRLNWMDNNMVGQCIEVGVEDLEEVKVELFPNPFSTDVDIVVDNFEGNTFFEIKIFNVFGKEITTLENQGNQITWNAESVASGVYFYVLKNKETVISKGKLVKQ